MKTNISLSCQNIRKTFGATIAIDGVSFETQAGKIHGLIGENGSGKTTLVSVFAGILKCDCGEMQKEDAKYSPSNIIDANKKGISMIVQEMATIDGLSIAQNIFFGHEKSFSRHGVLDLNKMNAEAKKLLEKYGIPDVDPSADITSLSFEQRKLTEFAKALYTDPQILIVDETTTALSQHGRDLLFKIIHDLRDSSKTVIFITHDLPELFAHCDIVTIMRDGKVVGTYDIHDLNENKVKALMVGREFEDGGKYYREDKQSVYEDEIVLKVENLNRQGSFADVSFELHKGEILGIGGLTNCGMHELGKVLFGIEKAQGGSVTFIKNSTAIPIKNARKAIANKIAYVSKNRDQESLMLTSSIMDNIALPGIGLITKATFISPRKKRNYADDNTKQLSVKMHNVRQMVMHLSGGNKQKVAISKWLANQSELFILDCPTRGIDVSVKAAVYKLMQDFKAQGRSVIMISEELLELIGMSDRIIMMKQGKISGIAQRGKDLSEEYLLDFMI
jgi:ribose transport system ATP-binding protein